MARNWLLVFCLLIGNVKYAFLLGENENIADLLALIENYISASEKYVFSKDNSQMLEVDKPNTEDFGEYDFIVIGAGAGGSVVANRLSEIGDWKVLVLEAGGLDNDISKIAGLTGFTLYSEFNWGYNSTPQTHGCFGMANRSCYLQHGKVIGGSTTVNSIFYSRGHPEDFNRWVNFGNTGWSYEKVLPYFKKSENAVFKPRDLKYHGEGGYVTLDHASATPEIYPVMVKAFEELGLSYADYNAETANVVSKPQVTLKGNERDSSAGFLKVQRSNLKISLDSFVTKILIDEATKNAYAVEFVRNRTKYIVKPAKEIILCGGGFNSAQILMLSGVGPSEHLQALDIAVIQDLPVGKNFQNHANYMGINLRTDKVLYNLTLKEKLELYIKNLKPLTSSVELVAFTNFGQSESKRPDVEYIFTVPALSGNGHQRYAGLTDKYALSYASNTSSDITIMVKLLHPTSRGAITLKSNSPKDPPLLDQNILATDDDIEMLYKGIQFILGLNDTQAFKSSGAELVVFDSPTCEDPKLSKAWWICSIKHFTSIALHPAGANSMGVDRQVSVVNPRLQVHGIANLRVVDESVMPEMNSGHNLAPTYMIAEKGADMIKEDNGSRPPIYPGQTGRMNSRKADSTYSTHLICDTQRRNLANHWPSSSHH